MRVPPMEVEKINNLSTLHTIHDIAECTAKDQAITGCFESRVLLAQHPSQPHRNGETKCD